MLTDDLPWPELGNVSRGATRGNQGSKGSLGPPDAEGRCILQLRVQPGVLAVKLNRRSSEWYRILDNEVQNALKETKTYWRKARRRQDYNPRADQDHMELHEWLQQLKDKVMSQLELLMQKGDIQGPPYVMPDNIEFSFMRKFIERQAQGVPHNPRLRNVPRESLPRIPHDEMSTESDAADVRGSTEASEPGSSSWATTAARSPVSSLSGAYTSSPISRLRTTSVDALLSTATRPQAGPSSVTRYGQDPSTSVLHGDFGSIAREVEDARAFYFLLLLFFSPLLNSPPSSLGLLYTYLLSLS